MRSECLERRGSSAVHAKTLQTWKLGATERVRMSMKLTEKERRFVDAYMGKAAGNE